MYITLRILCIAALCCGSFALAGAEKTSADAENSLLQRARSGNARAQLEAGFVFFKRNNPVRAAYWFQQAARQNLPEAQYNLARCHLEGVGVERNLHKAAEYFDLAAKQKLPEAMLSKAQLALTGIPAAPDANPPRGSVAPDEKTAFLLLEDLSKQNNAPAQFIYAEYLLKKYPLQHTRIIGLLDKSANAGYLPAVVALADYLLHRTDSLRDEKRARALLEKAAPYSFEAMARLAFAVENGFGAPPDPEKALKLYEKVLEKNFHSLAATRLANYYIAGRAGAGQDIPKAVTLYEKAAAAGVPEAMYHLGGCYSDGIGVNKDTNRAFELYFQAAKLDYPAAQYAVGLCFTAGAGTIKDPQAAFHWYNQAAMRGEPRAMLENGKCYLYGTGTEKDPEKALIFLQQAYANGINQAAEFLLEAQKQMKNQPQKIEPQNTPRLRFAL